MVNAIVETLSCPQSQPALLMRQDFFGSYFCMCYSTKSTDSQLSACMNLAFRLRPFSAKPFNNGNFYCHELEVSTMMCPFWYNLLSLEIFTKMFPL